MNTELPDASQEEQEVDTNLEESSTSEMSPQEQSAIDSLMPEKQKEEESSEEWDGKTPLHKVPRFKQLNEKLKEEQLKRKELEDKLQALEKGEPQTEEKPEESKEKKSEGAEESPVDYKIIDKMFEGTPEFKFKDDYDSIKDLYKDFRRAMMGELMLVRENQDKTKAEELKSYQSQVDSVLEEFEDEEEKAEFIEFAQSYIDEHSNKDPKTGSYLTDAQIAFFKRDTDKPKTKINKSVKAPTTKQKGPSQEYIKNKSMDDIMTEQLGL